MAESEKTSLLHKGLDVSPEELRSLVETPPEEVMASFQKRFKSLEGFLKALNTDKARGLKADDDEDHQRRRDIFGENKLPDKDSRSFLYLVADALKDTTLIVLSVCGVISLCLAFTFDRDTPGSWIEGTSILAAVVIVVLVTAINDYQKEKQFQALNAVKNDEQINVIRSGESAQVSTFKLLVGDIVCITTGDILTVDGFLIEGSDLKLDESNLTGESKLVSKEPGKKPILLSGTKVMEGTGRIVVIAVGPNCQSGVIATLVQGQDGNNKDDETILQSKLVYLAMKIGQFGTFIAILTFLSLTARFVITEFVMKHNTWHVSYWSYLVNFFIQGVTVLVVAVPEGLPLATTIALAFSVRRMLSENNLVRNLAACEVMGTATTIVSDKTGTLTANKMTVSKLWIGDETIEAQQLLGSRKKTDVYKKILKRFVEISSLDSNADIDNKSGDLNYIGNKTECALLKMVMDLREDYRAIRSQSHVEKYNTFTSDRKRMSVVCTLKASTEKILLIKGASEILLDLCTSYMDAQGQKVPLNGTKRKALGGVISDFGKSGLRSLVLGFRTLDKGEAGDAESEKNLVLVAIVGIEDPVRQEVPGAIKTCQRAGIVVRMCTGDNQLTACSIAKKCGILKENAPEDAVLDGPTFRKRVCTEDGSVKQEEFDKIWPQLRVLARSSPKDKYLLVTGLRESKLNSHREVIAVTGDGTNDGPALQAADVGFAMGIAGTSVAKDASDIVVMDDNFASIVSAVKWGRNVYESISKFIQFQLTVNVVAIILEFGSSVILSNSPLKAVQMLWINLIMDSLASLALATEPPSPHLLKRKPYPSTKPLISSTMFSNIITAAFYQLTVLVVIVAYGDKIFGVSSARDSNASERVPTVHYTLVFNTFVMMTLFNQINCRKVHGEVNVFRRIGNNKLFLGILVAEFLCQVLIVQFGGSVFMSSPLTLAQWLVCIALGALQTPLYMLKAVAVRKGFTIKILSRPSEEQHLNSAKLLWIRNSHRIRTQLRVIRLLKAIHRNRGPRPRIESGPDIRVLT